MSIQNSAEKTLYGGVNAAVATPMMKDFSIDLERMANHCNWLLRNGCDGLGILGTTGEANSLGIAERIYVMEGLVERGIPAERLLPGVGTTALTDTVKLASKARDLGCRGVLALPPFFYKNPSDDGLFRYFSEVIERIGAPPSIYLYHFPQQSMVPISVDLIRRLLKAYPGVVKGVKDSSSDFANTSEYVHQFAEQGFEVYCGDDSHLHSLLSIGGAGCITAASNVTCKLNAEVYANRANPAGEAAQTALSALRKVITSVPLIPGLKSLLAHQYNDPDWTNIRPPHLKLSQAVEAPFFSEFDKCTSNQGKTPSH
ncbi:dihydrodipicolinate synthase family protein [Bradyrhizobium sp. LTSP885]|uniref:dihydrodipicolinate synthase family protein n=1 Tax=Bradyrhizobium sp. LTSP885 TaxID=1619232 RepID=UPI0009E3641A|nr:dihydrodipicolinate synthase family protein [Bradyrhizobium sp. LTSP885]